MTVLARADEGHHRPVLLPDGRGRSRSCAEAGTARSTVSRWCRVRTRGTRAKSWRTRRARKSLVEMRLSLLGDRRFSRRASTSPRSNSSASRFHSTFAFNWPRDTAAPMYAVSSTGTLVYAQASGDRRLVWADRQGREVLRKTDNRFYSHLRLSPDGTRVAVYAADGDRDLRASTGPPWPPRHQAHARTRP